MRIVQAFQNRIIQLGRLGENEHTVVVFDISEWLQEYPTASFLLLNQRKGDSSAYPVNSAYVSIVADKMRWTITNAELSAEGSGRCELVITVDEVIAKSVIYTTRVLPALDGAGDVPSPWESWLDEFRSIVADAHAVALDSEAHAFESEGHAKGTRDGAAVGSDSPYYHNNSKYFAEEAEASKTYIQEHAYEISVDEHTLVIGGHIFE